MKYGIEKKLNRFVYLETKIGKGYNILLDTKLRVGF